MLHTDREISEAYRQYGDTVYRVCFLFMNGHRADVEDAVQTTFLRLMERHRPFDGPEHMKAWLIVTASNICRNMLRHWWRKNVNIEEHPLSAAEPGYEFDETLGSVLTLPDRYKTALYLYYYEGYDCKQIAKLTRRSQSSIWNALSVGRKMLSSRIEKGKAP